ncbi:2-phospho-D-glycerate hydro-lyase [Aphelenchoides besseyi]|nr:2-phospho-D-glycerate hydro-lyase [Aphelenchoides besseyi]
MMELANLSKLQSFPASQQNATIVAVFARPKNDFRGNATVVQVKLTTSTGGTFKAAVHHGKKVSTVLLNINEKIGPALKGLQVTEQAVIDNFLNELDGTENKVHSKVPLYQYIAKLVGTSKVVLPVPAFNVINGGSHAGYKLAMQEFMILSLGAKDFREAMQMGSKIYDYLKAEIKERYGLDATAVDDEKGFASNIQDCKKALDLLNTSVFWPVTLVDQIGTITESIEAAKLSRENGWSVMVSDRSGKTEDTFIADLVVGLSTEQIKTGAPCRSKRKAKYNQILLIEEELGNKAVYDGEKFRNPLA